MNLLWAKVSEATQLQGFPSYLIYLHENISLKKYSVCCCHIEKARMFSANFFFFNLFIYNELFVFGFYRFCDTF
uniref:Uncharacterized protein n=1 Tax=Anguilla anguilla TaxID=7936 RepID=A0A0E9X843_ANGAN